jgi:dipeptidyl aminopeptidase/acylaminoacyl peptidase
MHPALRLAPFLLLTAALGSAQTSPEPVVPPPRRQQPKETMGSPPLPTVPKGERRAIPRPKLEDGKRPFEPEDLFRVRKVADPRLSPDGSLVVFSLTETDLEKNERTTQLWIAPTDPEKGKPHPLTSGESRNSQARWSPDGKLLAFVSTRSGSAQIWTVSPAGGDPVQVTRHPADVAGPVWSPDGKLLAFAADTTTPCDGKPCNGNRAWVKEKGGEKATGRLVEGLLFRHWDSWRDGVRTHVFVVPAAGGEARDLTPGNFDAPPYDLGTDDDYLFTLDSKMLLYHRNSDPVEATSTNVDAVVVSLDGSTPIWNTTLDNKARDLGARFSPDGRKLAIRGQTRPGYEADRYGLSLLDLRDGGRREVTSQFDYPIERFRYLPDSKKILFSAEVKGRIPLYQLDLDTGIIDEILTGGDHRDWDLSADGQMVAWAASAIDQPTEIWVTPLAHRRPIRITSFNDELVAKVRFSPAEDVWYVGTDGTTIRGWLVKPPDYVPGAHYPVLVWVHGGPEGAWLDHFHDRWNPQPFVNAGFVVFMPNLRGSTGFGQPFTDAVRGEWGGLAYDDLIKAVEWIISRSIADPERIGAMGASFGGYLVNMAQGKTDRFVALLSHAGIFNVPANYGTTDELWFPEWEFGKVPWENPQGYASQSPHMLAKNFATPTLVTQGEQDYRVNPAQSLELYTILQRKGIPSKLLWFPDEGHWITKPQNSRLWYRTALDWFTRWLEPGIDPTILRKPKKKTTWTPEGRR